MLEVKWIKDTEGNWLSFETFTIANVTASGVYMIWHGGQTPRIVRLGQGDIKSRLTAHRGDNQITQYRTSGLLMVTWASVPAAQQDGVERHLANQWPPLVGDAFPDVLP